MDAIILDIYMAEKYNLRDNSPSIMHRFIGPNMLATDIDHIECNLQQDPDSIDDCRFLESSLNKDGLDIHALIEYKHGNIKRVPNNVAFQSLRSLAARASLPMFVVVYYGLDDDHDVPMMLVIPANKYACLYVPVASWCSVYEYSELMHRLRRMPFNPDAVLAAPTNDVEIRVRRRLCANTDASPLRVGHLSKERYPYPKPIVCDVEHR